MILTFIIFDYLHKNKMSRTDIFQCHERTPKANITGNFKNHELFFLLMEDQLIPSSNLGNDF